MDIYEKVLKDAERLNPDNLQDHYFVNQKDHEDYQKKYKQLIMSMESYSTLQKASICQLNKCINLAFELDSLYVLNHKK